MIDPSQKTVVGAAVNNVLIFSMDCQPAALTAGAWFPVALSDCVAIRTMQNSYRGIILLGAINPVGEVIVRGNPVELCGRLIVVGTPTFTAVISHLSAAVVANYHPL